MATTVGKRALYPLSNYHQHQWSVSKRPRYVATPTSAISVVTAEDDVISSQNTSSIIDYHLSSPAYTIHFPAPSTPAQLNDFPQHHYPLQSPAHSHSPPPYLPEQSPITESYQSRDISADVQNSFATGHTGPITWNNEMLIQVLTNDIENLCFTNHRNGASAVSDKYHNFFSQYKQPFELDFYLRRLVQYSNCSTSAFIVMLIYLDKIQENCPQLLVTEMNCHRLICTSLVLAIKYLDDEVFSNTYYARVGGVTADEMNQLEVALLNILDWNLSVSPETFSLYEEGLIESANSFAQHSMPCSPTSAA